MQTQSTLPARQFSIVFIVSDAFDKTTSPARFGPYQSNLLRVRAAVVGPYRPVHVKTLRSQKLRMLLTHLYGPAARCKPKMMIWRTLVLRFCIRPIDGAFKLLAIMDIRARSISFASRPRRPYGSPDHERAGETFLHLLFPARRPRRELEIHPAVE